MKIISNGSVVLKWNNPSIPDRVIKPDPNADAKPLYIMDGLSIQFLDFNISWTVCGSDVRNIGIGPIQPTLFEPYFSPYSYAYNWPAEKK